MGREAPGEVLRRLRLEAGLSQSVLAGRTGISVRTIRGIETGAVTEPRTTTLEELLTGLGLRGAGRRDARTMLRAGWSAPRSFAEIMRPDADGALAEAGVPTTSRTRLVSLARRAFVDEHRTVAHSRQEVHVEALEDGVDRHLVFASTDGTEPVPHVVLDELVGGAVHARTEVPHLELVVFEVSLGRRLAAGESCVVGYRIAGSARPPRGDTDFTADGFRRAVGTHSLQVVFAEPPRRLWEVVGADAAPVRALGLDPFGCAHITAEGRPPGRYGIGWQW